MMREKPSVPIVGVKRLNSSFPPSSQRLQERVNQIDHQKGLKPNVDPIKTFGFIFYISDIEKPMKIPKRSFKKKS